MKFLSLKRLLLLTVVAALAVLVFQPTAAAQCSMCRASLAGSNNALFIRNFNIGVLVLLVPPVAMFCSFFVLLRRHKLLDDKRDKRVNENQHSPESSPQ